MKMSPRRRQPGEDDIEVLSTVRALIEESCSGIDAVLESIDSFSRYDLHEYVREELARVREVMEGIRESLLNMIGEIEAKERGFWGGS